jgi:CheY-like chemotaxis protein
LGTPLRVLFIEDSARDAELQLRLLRQADDAVDSERVDTPDVLKQVLEKSWDFIISDYYMPRFPGTDALGLIKGSGSTFRIDLPAAKGAGPAPRKAPRFQLPKGTETILIAEDDDDVRETMRLILENLGYKVFAAGNGSEAVELFLRVKSSVDLVLLDVIMPVLNGPEAAARMSAIKPHLAFIFMTGYGIDSKLRELRTIEKTAILQKPFDAWQLANKLREVLDRKET